MAKPKNFDTQENVHILSWISIYWRHYQQKCRQITTAVADGTIAAIAIAKELYRHSTFLKGGKLK